MLQNSSGKKGRPSPIKHILDLNPTIVFVCRYTLNRKFFLTGSLSLTMPSIECCNQGIQQNIITSETKQRATVKDTIGGGCNKYQCRLVIDAYTNKINILRHTSSSLGRHSQNNNRRLYMTECYIRQSRSSRSHRPNPGLCVMKG